jgi:hypothetical protein
MSFSIKEKSADDPIQTPFEIRLLVGGFFIKFSSPYHSCHSIPLSKAGIPKKSEQQNAALISVFIKCSYIYRPGI